MRGERLRPIILAGGFGRRLSELVRDLTGRTTPKQFCHFGRPRSLLQETLARVTPLCSPADVVVVVDQSYRPTARAQLPAEVPVLAQPGDRGTGPGVLLPLAHVLREDPDAVVLVAPSDHAIADSAGFRTGIGSARRAVEEGVAEVVLFGVAAEDACGDYGWITPGDRLEHGLRHVDEFVEKPSGEIARRLCGAHALWHTMIVVARGAALFGLFERARPSLAALFRALYRLPAKERDERIAEIYGKIRPCDFSRDILAPARDLAVFPWPVELGWSDLGTPDRLRTWMSADSVSS